MTTTIVIGGQWGDEGKGKIVDYLASEINPDFGVRFNGGANAGHSIENNLGSFVLHLIPATIFTPGAISVIGNGVVIEPGALLVEMKKLVEKGVDISGLRISDRCHLIMPWHRLRESAEEAARGKEKIGTTGRGIGPCYADKAAREGFRVADLSAKGGWELLEDLYNRNLKRLPVELHGSMPALEQLQKMLRDFDRQIAGRVIQTEALLWKARLQGKQLLLEGAQGVLLDVDFGTYPRVTSSSTTRLGAYHGTGLPPSDDEVVVGIFKGYVTRVGEGAFPTELNDQNGHKLREIGHEYGATTGRARRCGWFDAVQARYAHRLNDFSWIVLTKNDVMDTFGTIRICVAYNLDGVELVTPPTTDRDLAKCVPVYQDMPGWQTPTSHIRHFADLPIAMQNYCRRLEELVGVQIGMISVGPKREETIKLATIS